MGIPGRGRRLYGFTAGGPRRDAPPRECQRPQHFPPWFDAVQVGRLCRPEDARPAGVYQGEPHDIGGPMGAQILHHRLEPLDIWGNPRLHSCEAVNVVRCGPSRTGRRQRRAIGRPEGANDIALAAAPLVNLLGGPPDRGGRLARDRLGGGRLDHHRGSSRNALRAFGAHLIQAHYDTARRRGGERRDAPLVSAKAGSTRSPLPGSWVRQRHPPRSNSSSIRERLRQMPLASCR